MDSLRELYRNCLFRGGDKIFLRGNHSLMLSYLEGGFFFCKMELSLSSAEAQRSLSRFSFKGERDRLKSPALILLKITDISPDPSSTLTCGRRWESESGSRNLRLVGLGFRPWRQDVNLQESLGREIFKSEIIGSCLQVERLDPDGLEISDDVYNLVTGEEILEGLTSLIETISSRSRRGGGVV